MIRALFSRWTWTMALRESRHARGRLLPFVAAMAFGIGALVALASFRASLEATLADQSRVLLGSDFRLRARQDFDAATEARIRERLVGGLGAEVARMTSFASMASFPRADAARLVQVRAVDGDFPFYGELETSPPDAADTYRAQGQALVADALLEQLGLAPGDVVRIGAVEYAIAGALEKIPGEAAMNALSGPRVYVPADRLDPALFQKGSRIDRQAAFRFAPGVDPEQVAEDWRDFADEHDLRVDTPQEAEESWGRSTGNLHAFLNLIGFVALVLGALGVGSAVHLHVQRKRENVAILRCLGATARATFAVYLAQALLLGAVAAVLGTLLGMLVQFALPPVLAGLVPFEVTLAMPPAAILSGIAIGLLATLGAALPPLLPLRRVPPLEAIRPPPLAGSASRRRDPAPLVVLACCFVALAAFGWAQAGSLPRGLAFAGAIAAVFAALLLLARAFMASLRRSVPRRLPYPWRQGLRNLHRPNNMTALLVVSLGLGSFLLLSLYQARASLLAEIERLTGGVQPDLVFFDVQDDQADGVAQAIERHGHDVVMDVPIVTMRIASVQGVAVRDIVRDARDEEGASAAEAERAGRRRRWSVTREYRSTYRSALDEGERIVAGAFVGRVGPETRPVPVSVEVEQAERLGLTVGDALTFDVQGVPVETVVGSLREVEWRQVRPNFFVVFPEGVLEEAPKFRVLMTRAGSPEAIGAVQRDVAERFPNVSAIDISMVIALAGDLLDRISFVVQFMAMFSVATGLLVLVSAVLLGRHQRAEEAVLLRTLGASRRQVARVLDVEYACLGLLAVAAGALLSLAGAWALCRFLFEIPFELAPLPIAAAVALLSLLTLVVGRVNQRGLLAHPPLAVLRSV